MTIKKEFGDFQTPLYFAEEVINLLSIQFGTPACVIEPTCGIGNFIEAANTKWGNNSSYYGFEINHEYCAYAKSKLSKFSNINITESNFFATDWCNIKPLVYDNNYVLVLGNPPWITNSALGKLASSNVPNKNNFQNLRGLDAMTGKSNFDIAEWMIIKLFECISHNGVLAMLCKTATARKVLLHLWKTERQFSDAKLYLIDAKKIFNVSVDASLFVIKKRNKREMFASVFSNLKEDSFVNKFGYINGELVADIDKYYKYKEIDGLSNYKWRSGVKHDASKVMELEKTEDKYNNGFGDLRQLETEFIYPLLKSSDLGNGRTTPRKFVIITQHKVGDDTEHIKIKAPLMWKYLNNYADRLNARQSSIYKKRPKFSIFGIGDYSFSLWKVAISGLYKKIRFVAIPPISSQSVMVDDTCYFFPCHSKKEAFFWENLLNTEECINFLNSLVFLDAKRPITIDILRRIDFAQLAKIHGVFEQAKKYLQVTNYQRSETIQPMFVFEDKEKYNKSHSKQKHLSVDNEK